MRESETEACRLIYKALEDLLPATAEAFGQVAGGWETLKSLSPLEAQLVEAFSLVLEDSDWFEE